MPHEGGNVTSAGWQVTLCDPMWHVSSRSGVATLRTAIHLFLTYLHSVTCHPAEATFPPLPQPKLVLDLATPKGCKAELT